MGGDYKHTRYNDNAIWITLNLEETSRSGLHDRQTIKPKFDPNLYQAKFTLCNYGTLVISDISMLVM